jgi:predicted ATP-dependent endonuclease of OLD family
MEVSLYIQKLTIKNFKKIEDQSFDFNDKVNILVGDNDSGKTTILEALELVSNCSYRGKSLGAARRLTCSITMQ